MVAFITYIKQFFNPIRDIADIYTSIQSSIISSSEYLKFWIQKKAWKIEPGHQDQKLKGEVEFKTYGLLTTATTGFKGYRFKIEPETVAFVGATGSGKSTIINLLGRFYNIQKGEILIDGININRYNLTDLRRRIAVVMQDVFLFSGDIASNIRLGDASISDSDIKEAAKYVCADEFIQALPNGFSEEVREGGSNFSSGQKQLISFARAVAFKPSILVLDEATSNIDTQTEIMIQNAVSKISSGKTSIIIAHRLSTIKTRIK